MGDFGAPACSLQQGESYRADFPCWLLPYSGTRPLAKRHLSPSHQRSPRLCSCSQMNAEPRNPQLLEVSFLTELGQSVLTLGVSSHAINKRPSWGLLSDMVSAFLSFWWVILVFKRGPRWNAKVLSRVPKHKRLWTTSWRKQLCVSMSFVQGSDGAVGHEFNGDWSQNTLDKAPFSRNTRKTRLHIDWSMRNGTRVSQIPKPIFSVGSVVQYLLIQDSWKFYKI